MRYPYHYDHTPIYNRATLSLPSSNIGLANDPPGLLPVIDRKPRQKPKPASDPIRDFAVFMAGVNALAERLSAATAPLVAVLTRFNTEYRAARERFSVRPPIPDR